MTALTGGNENTIQQTRPTWLAYTLHSAAGLLALAFLAAGGTKLAGVEMHVENFIRWGYPVFFMYVVGTIEAIGAVLILLPRTRFYGAALLALTMTGGVFTHFAAGEAAMVPVPLVLGLMAAFVVWNNRSTVQQKSI